MNKKCQIRAISPITCFTVPIIGTTELNLTENEIYQCLCYNAEIMEILSNGKMVKLNFDNYNRDNSIIGEPTEEKPYIIDDKEDVILTDEIITTVQDNIENNNVEPKNEKTHIVKTYNNETKNNNYKNNNKKKKK